MLCTTLYGMPYAMLYAKLYAIALMHNALCDTLYDTLCETLRNTLMETAHKRRDVTRTNKTNYANRTEQVQTELIYLH